MKAIKGLSFVVLFSIFTVLGGGGVVRADGTAKAVPTFAKDIAPILYENCTSCHRPGDIAPMSLITYRDTRPWARAIKDTVLAGEMPPWLADPHNSSGTFRDERILDQATIDTLVAWVDGGAPRGEGDLPALPDFPENWTYKDGEPDYVFELPVEYEIAAEGQEEYLDFYVAIPWEEDRFAEVIELRPSNRSVVHHAGAYVVDLPPGTRVGEHGILETFDGEVLDRDAASKLRRTNSTRIEQQVFNQFNLAGSSKLISYVPGRGVERFMPGTGKRVTAGKYVRFTMHYNAVGQVETDQSKLGLWFNTKPVTHEVLTRQAGNPVPTSAFGHDIYIVQGEEIVPTLDENGERIRPKIPNIPPYEGNWKITGITPITEPITLYGLSPHMHLRGKSLRWVVTFPDGREETILDVPKFDFNWQIHYELAEPMHIPAGSKITGIGVYDNSLANRWNPGPQLEVYWGDQSWDEMYQAFTEYTIDSQDLTRLIETTDGAQE